MFNPFKDLPKDPGALHSNPIIHRHECNPLLTAKNVPYPATFVFNAGVAYYRGKYIIAPRVDLFDEKRSTPALKIGTGMGWSDDGIHWQMEPELVRVHYQGKVLPWGCDARLTVLEDELYLTFCFENQHSERPGIAKWRGEGVDFEPEALKKLEALQADSEAARLPICIAKTQYSLSHDPKLLGRPKGWRMPVKDVLIYRGAGLVVPVAGEIKLMPGTSASPAYRRIDVDVETGKVKGLF